MLKPFLTMLKGNMKRIVQGPNIGELNGGWAFLHKAMLLLFVPCLLGVIKINVDLAVLKESATHREEAINELKLCFKEMDKRITAVEFKTTPP